MTAEKLIMEQADPDAFAGKLRALRALRGLDQRTLAAKSKVDRATISLLENGRRPPRISTVRKLADALGVQPETLRG